MEVSETVVGIMVACHSPVGRKDVECGQVRSKRLRMALMVGNGLQVDGSLLNALCGMVLRRSLLLAHY